MAKTLCCEYSGTETTFFRPEPKGSTERFLFHAERHVENKIPNEALKAAGKVGCSSRTPLAGIFLLIHGVKKLVWQGSVSFQLNPIYEIISYCLWFRK